VEVDAMRGRTATGGKTWNHRYELLVISYVFVPRAWDHAS
jgi:hypothetical protein